MRYVLGHRLIFIAFALVLHACSAKVNDLATTGQTSNGSGSGGSSSGSASVSLTVVPSSLSLAVNRSHLFLVTGGTPPYTFSIPSGGGSVVSATGYYTAPAVAGAATVRVTDSVGAISNATVTIQPKLSITPSTRTLAVSNSVTFSASGGDGTKIYSIIAGDGTIDPSTGAFTASANAGISIVEVRDGSGDTAQAVVIVNPALAISPSTLSLANSSTYLFSASGGVPPYAYSVVSGGGSFGAPAGTYTSPAAPGAVTVRVTDSLSNTSDATVTVTTALTLSPSNVTVNVNGTQLFTASGGSGSYTYSVLAGGGSMSGATYTAPASAGAAIVRVTDSSGSYRDASVTVGSSYPVASFVSASGLGGEATSPVSVHLDFTPATTQAGSVLYTIGGSATDGGTDYSITVDGVPIGASGTLNVGVGVSRKTFLIAVNNDALVEPNETITISLGTMTNLAPGANTSHTYVISDNETLPTLSFTTGSSSAPETTAAASFTVELSKAFDQTVTANYAITGTATGGGVDYTLGAGSLSFAPGETQKTISLTGVVNDTAVEADETVVITLNTLVNADPGANMAHTYTIEDDDSNILYLSGSGGSTLNGVAITSCGGGSACNSANPYVINSDMTFSDVILENNAYLSAAAWASGVPVPGNGILRFTVQQNMSIASGSVITMDAKGHTGSNGTGAGAQVSTYSSGGGHGGLGGRSSTNAAAGTTHGDFRDPTALGSGGGAATIIGGIGGGAIRIVVGGTLTLNGTIRANGGNALSSAGGGGSGGSVNLSVSSLAGTTGSITVNGGNSIHGNCGTGGGGRIAISYSTQSYTGGLGNLVLTAYAGSTATSFQKGGAGTIFLRDVDSEPDGRLIVDANNVAGNTTLLLGTVTLDHLTIRNQGNLEIPAGHTLATAARSFSSSPSITVRGTYLDDITTLTNLNVVNFGSVNITGNNLTIGSGGTYTATSPVTFNSLVIQNGGKLTHYPNTTAQTYTIDATITTNLTVDLGGTIDVDGRGYIADNGPGVPSGATYGPGAGHGGQGGRSYGGFYGVAYDDVKNPTQLGSGGRSDSGGTAGSGGGVVKMSVGGTLTLNGSITADGTAGIGVNNGGGSGGTINIVTGTLAGSTGSLSVDGGAPSGVSANSAGGAGGRIALVYTTNTYAGGIAALTKTAVGGTAVLRYQPGGTGTIYIKGPDSGPTNGRLIVDAGGLTGTPPAWLLQTSNFDDVYISTYSSLEIRPSVTLSSASSSFQLGSTLINRGTYNNTLSVINGWELVNFGTLNLPTNALTIGANGILSLGSNAMALDGLTIQSGGLVTHYPNEATQATQLDLTINGNLTIDSGGMVDLSGRGHTALNGPGKPASGLWGPGAGHGGMGGGSSASSTGGPVYDNIKIPALLGSGGGSDNSTSGGAGGGYGRIVVTGTLALNGDIRSNGLPGVSNGGGGGSGGSLHVTAGTVTGAGGGIYALGGNAGGANSGGGSGGRIAFYYTTMSYTGGVSAIPMAAYGGSGPSYWQPGGAGTIFVKAAASTNGDLIVDNNGLVNSPVTQIAATYTFDDIKFRNGAQVELLSGYTLGSTTFSATSDSSFTNRGTFTNAISNISGYTLVNYGSINVPTNDLTLGNGGTLVVGNNNLSLDDLVIESGGTLSHVANTTAHTNQLNLTIGGNLTIDSGGKIDVSAKGYAPDSGPGWVNAVGGPGAGYGGQGGGSLWLTTGGGAQYGDVVNPIDLGSGGDSHNGVGGAGGGYANINVTGVLTLNGSILSNGGDPSGQSGGGSGGTVKVVTGTLAGSTGLIAANGGSPVYLSSGGGSGGRISLTYTTDLYTGGAAALAVAAYGGNAAVQYMPGATGTIYLKHQGVDTNGTLVVDGNHVTGNVATSLGATYAFDKLVLRNRARFENKLTHIFTAAALESDDLSSFINRGDLYMPSTLVGLDLTNYGNVYFTGGNLTIGNGGTLIVANPGQSLTSLVIQNGGRLTHLNNSNLQTYVLNLTVTGNMTIDAGGAINLDGKGYAATFGPGVGGNGGYSAGGGHGGAGARSASVVTGGAVNDTASNPQFMGSGGGQSGSGGGAGGGYANINVTGTLTLNGTISANGGDAQLDGSGGGAGGAFKITVGTIAGSTGNLSARGGGVIHASSGPGGGGMIKFTYTTDSYTGGVSALARSVAAGTGGTYLAGAGTVDGI